MRSRHNKPDPRVERLFKGIPIFVASIIILVLLGTDIGRVITITAVLFLIVTYFLGWVGEVLNEAYQEYVK